MKWVETQLGWWELRFGWVILAKVHPTKTCIYCIEWPDGTIDLATDQREAKSRVKYMVSEMALALDY